jgi:mRNA-degrading endonuclease RelE of RelBE toxin-antitoxin system
MFEIEFTASAIEDLSFLRKFEQRFVVDMIERHLAAAPLEPARNRKPLRPNDLSSWELRLGDFRVFYDVDAQGRIVKIKAVGWKEHNQLFIRGKEFSL